MFDPTTLILVHFVSAGIQSLVHKVAAGRGVDSLLFINCQAATTCLALLVPFLILVSNESDRLLALADNVSNLIVFPAVFLFLAGAFVAVSFARFSFQTPVSKLG